MKTLCIILLRVLISRLLPLPVTSVPIFAIDTCQYMYTPRSSIDGVANVPGLSRAFPVTNLNAANKIHRDKLQVHTAPNILQQEQNVESNTLTPSSQTAQTDP